MAAAGSSRFAVTCGLLRQYVREPQPRLGGLAGAFRLPPLAEAQEAEDTDGRTMQLFPTRAGSHARPADQGAQAKAPLTILYNGRVLVFEDFPADKAEELMQLAGSGSSPAAPEKPSAAVATPAAPSDLPIARKASLQRFLQKRKQRISTTDPYHKEAASPEPEKDVAAGKPAKHEPVASWLAL